MQEAFVASVRSGAILGDGAYAAITFEVGGDVVSVAIPARELTSLLTLCMGLSAQAAAGHAAGEVQVLPVEDWDVGRTASDAVTLRLASDTGASLTYRLGRRQALELRNAIALATAIPPRSVQHIRERAAQVGPAQLAELVRIREQCRDHPATVQLVDRCLALLNDLDAANDEGRAAYRRRLLELVGAARDHMRAIESPLALAVEEPSPAAP